MTKMNLLKENVILRELIVGELFFGVVCQILLLIFTKQWVYNSLGLWIGVAISVFLAVNMADSIDVALDLDAKNADAYLRKKSVIRYLIVCAAVVLLGIFDLASVLTCIFGVMGLKVGAYLQPITHKLFNKNEIKPDYSYMDNDLTREGIDVYYVKSGDSYEAVPVNKNQEGGEEVNE